MNQRYETITALDPGFPDPATPGELAGYFELPVEDIIAAIRSGKLKADSGTSDTARWRVEHDGFLSYLWSPSSGETPYTYDPFAEPIWVFTAMLRARKIRDGIINEDTTENLPPLEEEEEEATTI